MVKTANEALKIIAKLPKRKRAKSGPNSRKLTRRGAGRLMRKFKARFRSKKRRQMRCRIQSRQP